MITTKKFKKLIIILSCSLLTLSTIQPLNATPTYDYKYFTDNTTVEQDLNTLISKIRRSLNDVATDQTIYDDVGNYQTLLLTIKKSYDTENNKIPIYLAEEVSNLSKEISNKIKIKDFDSNSLIIETKDNPSLEVINSVDTISSVISGLLTSKLNEYDSLSALSDNDKYSTLVDEAMNWKDCCVAIDTVKNYSNKYGFELPTEYTDDFIKKTGEIRDTISETVGLLDNSFKNDENKLNLENVTNSKELCWHDNDLSNFYLKGFSVSATFVPFSTNIFSEETYAPLFKDIASTSVKKAKYYMSKIQPVYATVGKSATLNYSTMKTAVNPEPLTLRVFMENVLNESKQMVLFTKNKSIKELNEILGTTTDQSASEIPTQSEPTDNTTEQTQENEEVIATPEQQQVETTNPDSTNSTEDPKIVQEVWSKPILFVGEMKYIKGGLETDTADRILVTAMSNYNTLMLRNIFNNINIPQDFQKDLDESIGVDMFGNIVSHSGYVIYPAVCNPCFQAVEIQDDIPNNAILPMNMALNMSYPQVANLNGILTTSIEQIDNKGSKSPYMLFSMSGYDYKDLKKDTSTDLSKIMLCINPVKHNDNGSTVDEKFFTERKSYPLFNRQPIPNKNSESEEDTVSNNAILYDLSYFTNLPKSNNWFQNLRGKDPKQNKDIKVLTLDPPILKTKSKQISSSIALSNNIALNQITSLNYAYLTCDKDTFEVLDKHNGTLDKDMMLNLAVQTSTYSQNLDEALLGVKIMSTENEITELATLEKIFNGIFNGIYSGLVNFPMVSTIYYTPKFTELNLTSKFASIAVPILASCLSLYIIFLILCWFPFRKFSSVKVALFRIITLILVSYCSFKLVPVVLPYVYNYPFRLFSQAQAVTSSLVDQESTEQRFNITRNTVTSKALDKSSYIVLANLDKQQYAQVYDLANGLGSYKQDKALLNFVSDNNVYQLGNNLTLNQNKICMSLPQLYSTSSIKGFEIKGASLIYPDLTQVRLFQTWETPSEIHYFTPYHLIIENLLHKENTLNNTINAKIAELKYPTGYKYVGFTYNYLRSMYYLKTPADKASYREQFKAVASQIGDNEDNADKLTQTISLLNSLDADMGDTNDLLGIMMWSGIVTPNDNDALGESELAKLDEFRGKDTTKKDEDKEDEEEKETLGNSSLTGVYSTMAVTESDSHSLTNTHHAIWYRNPYFVKARNTVDRIIQDSTASAGTSELVINGYLATKDEDISVQNGIPYVSLELMSQYLPTATFTEDNGSGEAQLFTDNTIITIKDNKMYANGVFLKHTEPSGNTYSLQDIMIALNGAYYYNENQNIAFAFIPNNHYYGAIGQVYQKSVSVASNLKEYTNSIFPLSNYTSDENLIKSIALYATILFNKEFTTPSYPLYPTCVQSNNQSLDTYFKTTLLPTKELTYDAGTGKIIDYITTHSSVGGSGLLVLLTVLTVAYVLIRDCILLSSQLILPFYLILIFGIGFHFEQSAKQFLKIMLVILGLTSTVTVVLTITRFFTSKSIVYLLPALGISVTIIGVASFLLGRILFELFKKWITLTASDVKSAVSGIRNGINDMTAKVTRTAKQAIPTFGDNNYIPPAVPSTTFSMEDKINILDKSNTTNFDTGNTPTNEATNNASNTSSAHASNTESNLPTSSTPVYAIPKDKIEDFAQLLATIPNKKIVGDNVIIPEQQLNNASEETKSKFNKLNANTVPYSKQMESILKKDNVSYTVSEDESEITYYKQDTEAKEEIKSSVSKIEHEESKEQHLLDTQENRESLTLRGIQFTSKDGYLYYNLPDTNIDYRNVTPATETSMLANDSEHVLLEEEITKQRQRQMSSNTGNSQNI